MKDYFFVTFWMEKLDGLNCEKLNKNYNDNRIQQSIGDNRKTPEVIKENILDSDNRYTIKIISKDCQTVTDPTDMTNSFNKYFSEMAESISNALPSVPDEQHYLNSTTNSHQNTSNQQDRHRLLYAATEVEVRSVIKNLILNFHDWQQIFLQ
jgi:hypothetical protein